MRRTSKSISLRSESSVLRGPEAAGAAEAPLLHALAFDSTSPLPDRPPYSELEDADGGRVDTKLDKASKWGVVTAI